jgi:hypothetical protein
MFNWRRWQVTLWPALALVLASLAVEAAPTRGPLRISGTPTRFEDSAGRTVWLSGMIICCGPFAQTNGWPWISHPMLDRIAQSGGNWANVRLGPFTRSGELERYEPYRFVGGHQYDLDQWNPAFWTDLRDTVAYARDLGIYVEIDLIDGWPFESDPERDLFSPWKAGNNLQGIADDCGILHSAPAPHHVRWLEKVAETVGEFDNVIFQVGNETSDCDGGGTSIEWEDGVILEVRAALHARGYGDRLFSTNSENGAVEALGSVDYVNMHQPGSVGIRAGKPTGVNEYREDAFDANGYTREMWNGFTSGTSFQYWRGDDDDATFDTVLTRISIFRKFLARTGLARFGEEPINFRVVGDYGREYVGFLPNGGSREIDLGPSLQEFQVEWLDPRTGLVVQGENVTASGSYFFEPPAPTGAMLVLHVYAQDGCPDCTPPTLTGWGDGDYVNLEWVNDYVGIKRFLVERKQEPSGPWVPIASNLPPETTTYADAVPPGTYSYRVNTHYLTGGSGYSNTVTVSMFAAPPPNPPVNLRPNSCAAMPPHFTWDPPPTATGYYMRASTLSGVNLINNSGITVPSHVPTPGEMAALLPHVGEPILWSVKACNNRGCSSTYAPNQTITLRRAGLRADWNGDCLSDLLVRNDVTGDLSGWMLDGAVKIGETALTPARPAAGNWLAAGTSDFDDDGQGDVLWWNQDSGNLAVWYLDGAVRRTGAAFTGLADLHWRPVATADLTGDRRAEVIWRRSDTGALSAGVQSGSVFTQQPLSPSTMDPAWSLAAVGDLTGDGRPDLLWRHTLTGALQYWAMDGLRRVGGGPVTSAGTPDQGWRVVGIWPVDQDASPDIVWQNQTSRALVVWHMNGAAHVTGEQFTPSATPAGFSAIGPR